MGYPKYFEDIRKKADELHHLTDGIGRREISYSDQQRTNVVLAFREIASLVDKVEQVWDRIGVEDKELVQELLDHKKEIAQFEVELTKKQLALKEAEKVNARLLEEKKDEQKKLKFVIDLFQQGNFPRLINYLRSIA